LPDLVVIAGPNGAGKSTAAPLLIGKRLGIAEFVNADVIAAGLSGFSPENAAFEAGRIMLRRLDALAASGADFAFETTLASRHFARWIAKLTQERGYRFHLFYLWLPDVEQNVRRVAGRVRQGGHAVPEDVIRRRYASGLANFHELYRPIADWWGLYDNSDSARLIAEQTAGRSVKVFDLRRWSEIQKRMEAREQEGLYEGAAGESTVMGVPVSQLTEAIQEAGREARRRHKALGYPIVIMRDGKVIEVPPEEIEV
jgi:predicted ABC-type ATPase